MTPRLTVLRDIPIRMAKDTDVPLGVPTVISMRFVPMKLVIDQRIEISNFLKTSRGGKVSFAHLIAYAMIQALKTMPAMNNSYDVINGKSTLIENPATDLGIAIDLKKPDGTRQLLVPNIRGCEKFNFAQSWADYEKIITKACTGEFTMTDFAGTTTTITNPGGIGTDHSVPQLMNGQGMILGVGNIDYPVEFQGTSLFHVDGFGISKVTTLTSTYDHRVIQGAQSGGFLKIIRQLLPGEQSFCDKIFETLRIPYEPPRWGVDVSTHREDQVAKQRRVLEFVNAYYSVRHLAVDINPLEYRQRLHEDLRLEAHGLSIQGLDRKFAAGSFGGQEGVYRSLREILAILQDPYCRTVAIEYMHIAGPQRHKQFQDRIEVPRQALTRQKHMHALDKLNEVEVFETLLQTKFIGQKCFSLESGESTIVLSDETYQQVASEQLDEVCIGMLHRGRLNVMSDIVGRGYIQIFHEFVGTVDVSGTGDVKYHLGSGGKSVANNGATIKASVVANPFHLEAANPVLQGITQAKQDMVGGDDFPVLPLLLHGDAAFYSQGVIFETLQMSRPCGYRIGGTIHIVVNNQVEFATTPIEPRTSTYRTDVAKTVSIPMLHVNDDDPDSYIRAARPVSTYRQQFHEDAVIDLVCYRRHGHNKGDDLSFTQLKMYDLIGRKRSARRLYTEAPIGHGDISMSDAGDVIDKLRARLENMFKEARGAKDTDAMIGEYIRMPYYPTKQGHRFTEITLEMLHQISEVHTRLLEGSTPHPKVPPQLKRRADQIFNGPINWATAELPVIGPLLMEGQPVQLIGQDSHHGTFSQRFATIVDRITNEAWMSLKHLSDDQATFDICDSLLSEYTIMGFEYGYSVVRPGVLVLWKAQFGDFASDAQIAADKFVVSGQAKRDQKSDMVLSLPHGFEGQGPGHSSTRVERWLRLCTKNTLAVSQPLTAASHFHLLHQHAYMNYHRPVVVATPKSTLRSRATVSLPEEFTSGTWYPVLDGLTAADPFEVTRLLICSGKIRWEFVISREKFGLDGKVVIIPLERLYPLPGAEMAKVLERYRRVTDIRFVQNEPVNQEPWPFISVHLPDSMVNHTDIPLRVHRTARPWSSASSVGSMEAHQQRTADLMNGALGV